MAIIHLVSLQKLFNQWLVSKKIGKKIDNIDQLVPIYQLAETMPAVDFSELTIHDIPTLLHWEQQLFDYFPYNEAHYQKILTKEKSQILNLKVSCENQFAGWLSVELISHEANLITLAILPDYQQKGLGKKLLQLAIDYARSRNCQQMILEVAAFNQKALHLYQSFNFAINRTRKGYFNGLDAYEMILPLCSKNH